MNNHIQLRRFNRDRHPTSFTDPNQRRLLEIAKTLRGDNVIHHFCVRKRYKQSNVAHALTGHDWQSLYHFTIGNPVEDLRLRTEPPYAHLKMGGGR